jgi:hypothetical protein
VRRAILGLLFRTLGMLPAHAREIITQAETKAVQGASKGFNPDPANIREIHRLCSQFVAFHQRYSQIVKSQACVRRRLAMRRVSKMRESYNPKRCAAFNQIYKAARVLCNKLQALVCRFAIPLEDLVSAGTPILTSEEIMFCFGEVRQVFILHDGIRKKLKRIHDNWPRLDGVGAIFLEIHVHAKYFTNFAINT